MRRVRKSLAQSVWLFLRIQCRRNMFLMYYLEVGTHTHTSGPIQIVVVFVSSPEDVLTLYAVRHRLHDRCELIEFVVSFSILYSSASWNLANCCMTVWKISFKRLAIDEYLESHSRSSELPLSVFSKKWYIIFWQILWNFQWKSVSEVISQNLTRSRDPEHTPSGVICYPRTTIPQYQSAFQIWNTYLHPLQRYYLSPKISNGSRDRSCPFSGMIFHLWTRTCYYKPIYQIWSLWDVARYWLKIIHFNLRHLYLVPPVEVIPIEFRWDLSRQKYWVLVLLCGAVYVILRSHFIT